MVIALLLLRRLLQSVKRQRLMALDVKQAQEVQQVILPEARLVLPGLAASRASTGRRAKWAATSSRSFRTKPTAAC